MNGIHSPILLWLEYSFDKKRVLSLVSRRTVNIVLSYRRYHFEYHDADQWLDIHLYLKCAYEETCKSRYEGI